jgi:hypothetical protein
MRARKEFPKDSAWNSPKGPFRDALKRRALPPASAQQKEPNVGREYSASLESLWMAIPSVLEELGLKLAGDNKQEGTHITLHRIA